VVQWYSGTVLRCYSDSLLQGYSGAVVQYYSIAVVQKFSVAGIQWCSGAPKASLSGPDIPLHIFPKTFISIHFSSSIVQNIIGA
jgi:hypothetical protein